MDKWKDLKKWRKWVIILGALTVLGWFLNITGLAPETSSTDVEVTKTSASSTTSDTSRKSSNPDLSNPRRSEKKSVTEDTSSSSQPSSSNSTSYVTAEQMPSFIEYFQTDLIEKGIDISDYSFYHRDTILYMTVPDEYKYYNKTELQAFADGMKDKEHEAFNVWSVLNHVNYERYTMFHIKSDDGTSIASQSINGEMKLKVK